MFLKFLMAYVGGCQVDTWAETHDGAVDVLVFEISNWRDSTSVLGSLVDWGLILNFLIVVMVTDGVVREIPVCEGVF